MVALTQESLGNFLSVTPLQPLDIGVLAGAVMVSWLAAEVIALLLRRNRADSRGVK
ncbi:MAG: hypothetical protein R3F38_08975 [Gammaproteobacteria bacterium]